MEAKIRIVLTDDTWIKGIEANCDGRGPGIYVKDARKSGIPGTPIGNLVFFPLPNASIKYIIIEE